MPTFSIAVLGGDGIGPEVVQEAVRVLDVIAKQSGARFEYQYGLVGSSAIKEEGTAISARTMEMCKHSDAVLFGAVGSAEVQAKIRPEMAILQLRKELDLFANLRPVKSYKALLDASTIKPEIVADVDMLVVRELTAGLYFGKPSEIRNTDHGSEAVDTLIYSEYEIERVVRSAFEFAGGRRKKVTSVDKANVLSSSRLWRSIVERVSAGYPDVSWEHALVDSCAMSLIRQPAKFDVIVTENMFGDILTDEASMITGSLGMLPSASLGVRNTEHGVFGLYEPIHGTAPDIEGQNKANPLAAILSSAMMLRYSCGLGQEAILIEKAVSTALERGYRTIDISSNGTTVLGTSEMGDVVIQALEELITGASI